MRSRNRRAAFALAVVWMASLSDAALAQGSTGLDRGRAFVQGKCGGCHAVSRTDLSRHPTAPPFRTLGQRYPIEHLAEALAEGIMVAHSTMPVFKLRPEEVGDVLDYISSLQKPAPGK